MLVRHLHDFDLTPTAAIALQKSLAREVVTRGAAPRPLRRVLGVDCAGTGDRFVAAAVLCEAPDWRVVETAVAAGRPGMEYVPGLLSFRELPLVLEALRLIQGCPDVVLVDGAGFAHPRRLGLACHLGLHLDRPTIGVAKSRLVGTHDEPGPERGAWAGLLDGGRAIGRVLRTRDLVKPLYVSVGHGIALRSAVSVVLRTHVRTRLPEPIRQADLLSKRQARAPGR